MKAVLQEKSTHIHANVQRKNTFMVCSLQKKKLIEHQTVSSCILLSRSVRILCLQTELTAIIMEDFIHFLQAAMVQDLFSGLYYDQEMLR